MKVAWQAAVCALALVACRPEAPEAPEAPEPAGSEGSADPTPEVPSGSGEPTELAPVRLENIARIDLAGHGTAIAVSDGGVVAAFGGAGSIAWHRLPDTPDGVVDDGLRHRFGGQVVDAGFVGETLYAIDREGAALWRIQDVDGQLVQHALDLGAQPVDLWLDDRSRRAWVLIRDLGATPEVAVIDLAPGGEPRVGEISVSLEGGDAPVGFLASRDAVTLALPQLTGRSLRFLNVEPPTALEGIELEFRPRLAVWLSPYRAMVSSSNSGALLEVRMDAHVVTVAHELEDTPTLLDAGRPGASEIYAVAGGSGQLLRVTLDPFEVAARQDSLALVTDLALVGDLLLATESQSIAGLAALDPETLEVQATVPLAGRPGRMLIHDDLAVVMNPAESTVNVVRVVDER